MKYNHLKDREEIQWGTYGKGGNEPLKHILVKDLENSHLVNIISHIQENHSAYHPELLQLMKDELAYRVERSFMKI